MTTPVNFASLISELKSEARESRRAVEKRTRRLTQLDLNLQTQIEANTKIKFAMQQLDQKIEETTQREKKLHHLINVAKKRKTKLQMEVKGAEEKSKTVNQEIIIPIEKEKEEKEILTSKKIFHDPKRIEIDHILHGKRDGTDIQLKLYTARARYRKLCSENQKLLQALSDINAEEYSSFSRRNESINISNNSENNYELATALQDLINSFEAVTRVSTRIE